LQYQAYSEVLARYNVRVSTEEYATQWIAAGRGPEYAVRTYALPVAPDELRAMKSAVYDQLLRRAVRLMPGAATALARLHGQFPLAVATNSSRADVGFVLEHFDLRGFFSATVCRDDYTNAKPEPDAFLTAAQRLQVPPRGCLVVEDSHRGVLAAARAGMVPVAVPHPLTRASDFSAAVRILGSLNELTVELVEGLLGKTVSP
jgi:pseudouridine-5'-monophosphatase